MTKAIMASPRVWFALVVLSLLTAPAVADDWDPYAIPADPGAGMRWELANNRSDQFNYDTSTTAGRIEFDTRWRDSKPDGWLGPGATYFSQENYFVDDGALTVFGSRVPAAEQIPNFLEPGFTRNTYTSYITSKNTLRPGVYTEVRMKGGGTPLSSNFWLLDDKNETEIDVLEIYGDTDWFRRHPATNVHFFKRDGSGGGNFNNQDHHPSGFTNYAQTWHRYGVHWVSETLVEFYYDGDLVRTLDLPSEIVDPSGQYLNEPLRLILDLEAHSWRGQAGIPSDAELADPSINNMQVDWVRTYELAPLLTGDYNSDGVVDAADFTVWRDNYGGPSVTPFTQGDGDGDGFVTLFDYGLWFVNYGGAAGGSAAGHALPEPGASLPALAAIGVVLQSTGPRRSIR